MYLRQGDGVLADLLLVAEPDQAGRSPPSGWIRESGVTRVVHRSHVAT